MMKSDFQLSAMVRLGTNQVEVRAERGDAVRVICDHRKDLSTSRKGMSLEDVTRIAKEEVARFAWHATRFRQSTSQHLPSLFLA